MAHNSCEYLHTVIEALSLSFADTLWYNADPSKVKVPVSGLLSKEYATKRRDLIKPDRLVKLWLVPGHKGAVHVSPHFKYDWQT